MRLFFVSWLTLLMSGMVMADSVQEVKQRLIKKIPELADAQVSVTPIAGLYAVQQGVFIFYASADASYVVRGDLLSLEDKRNLTEEAQQKFRLAAVNQLDEKSTINFVPEKTTMTHRIFVFTDVDCPYCHQLHQMVPKLLENGIGVRYVMYPRAGIDSPTYNKTVHAWCQRQNKAELEQMLKGGGKVGQLTTCAHPIKQQFALAGELGLQGTPSIILPDGRLIPGLAPIDELIRLVKSQ